MVPRAEAPRRAKLVIFVDANALLELYEHFDPRVDELPAKLVAAGDSLFLPRQVADEVERGKLRVAHHGVRRVLENLSAPRCDLPVGLRKHADALRVAVETLKRTIAAVKRSATAHLDAVARSEDSLSEALAPVLAKAAEASTAAFERARVRRERGNPPGKPGDPLGDQLSWEQLLEHVEGAEALWIVTGDSDFGIGGGTTKRGHGLNPLLHRDLQRAAPGLTAKIFGKEPKDLARALNDYFAARGLADERFSEAQLEYFDRLAEEAERTRKPWECRTDRQNTPIESATCAACGGDLARALGEEMYTVRRSGDGYEIEFEVDEQSGPVSCTRCSNTVFEVEFASFCSYCQRVADAD